MVASFQLYSSPNNKSDGDNEDEVCVHRASWVRGWGGINCMCVTSPTKRVLHLSVHHDNINPRVLSTMIPKRERYDHRRTYRKDRKKPSSSYKRDRSRSRSPDNTTTVASRRMNLRRPVLIASPTPVGWNVSTPRRV
jgi:hypothetical protein